MRKIILLFLAFVLGIYTAKTQSCIPTTINGTVLTLACGQPCTSFTYQVPHLKSTTDYIVNSTPYAPYVNTAGTTIPSIYIDDKYSPLIPMAFPFCFYGLNYNNMVVGSNGIITFEALCANASNAFTLDVGGVPQPLPYAGGAGPSGIFTTYYPRTAIMGAYYDIDPSVSPLPTRRIEYNVFGVAPCRKLVISFVDVKLFSCTSLINTTQMVLHESTGLIEVFLTNKPNCPGWNNGLGILGIQDDTRTKFAAAAGKNCTQWTESNTGYRFTPNGGTSSFVNAQLFTMGGVWVATADTATTIPGILDITFPAICPPAVPSTQYEVRTTFLSCTGVPMVSSDFITVNRINVLPATITTNPTTCGLSIGSITITPTGGTGPFTYTLNAGAPVVVPGAHTFTGLATGPYTIVATDITGCTNTFNVNVATTATIPGTITATQTSCPLSTDATITVTPTGGTAPYSFSLDGGPGQASGIFINVAPGLHTVIFTDFAGCTGTVSINVTAGSTPLTATVNSTGTSCPTVSNGTITVTPTSGSPAYQYSLDGGPNQPGNVFINVTAGAHSVQVTDVFGCTGVFPVNVAMGPSLTATVNSTGTSCPTVNNGTITVTPTSGTPAYQYSLDGGPNQPGNVFINVSAGAHSVTVTDIAGCSGVFPVNVAMGPSLTANLNTTGTSCPTVSDGTITVTPTSGTPAYQYSLDGGPNQPGNIFTNVTAGAHTVTLTDQIGCTGTFPINVAQGALLSSTIAGINPPCSNINNGSITITPTSGTAPYQYSLNGGAFQPSNVFAGLAPGFYTINFSDNLGCTGVNTITLITNLPITATSTNVQPLCNGVANGSITINAAGGVGPYQYSINGGATYQVNATFGGLAAGTYNFLVKDAFGCIFPFTFILTEPTAFTVSALATSAASCSNNDGSLSITAVGGTPAYQYSINNGISYQASNVFSGLPIGNYAFIRVKDINGCIANTTVFIPLNDTMRLELGTDSTICFGRSMTILPQTNALTDTFKWTPATWLDYDTAKNPVTTPLDTIKYYLTAKWGVCQRTDSITINVLHKPVAFAGNDTTICYKTNATLRGSASNLSGTVNYSWAPPDSLNTPTAATTIARMDTTRQFTLTVTDNYGCGFSVSDSMWVIMQPVVPAFAGNDTNAMANKPHQLLGSGGGISGSYLWSPASPLDNPFIQNPKAVLNNDTYFTLVVTDAIGCSASDGVFIKVYEGPEYYVPNAFTPNGDGLNDIFRPIPVGMRSTDYFRVFNRNGQQVFETNKWLQGWDGRFKGNKADQGTYVWMIKGKDVNGRVIEMHGTVVLVR